MQYQTVFIRDIGNALATAWGSEFLQWPINTICLCMRHVDLLSFQINFVGFSDDDNLLFCMPISRQNLWTIWSAFQYGIPNERKKIVIGQSRARHCVMTLGESTKINFNRKRVIDRNEPEPTIVRKRCKYLVSKRNFYRMCHCWRKKYSIKHIIMLCNWMARDNRLFGSGFLVPNECEHCLFMFLIGKGAALLWGWCYNSCFDATFLTRFKCTLCRLMNKWYVFTFWAYRSER